MCFKRERYFLAPAIRLASQLVRQVKQNHLVRAEKMAGEPVTIADYGSQSLLCRVLQRYFPEDAIVAEETASEFLEAVQTEQQEHICRLLSSLTGQPLTLSTICSWLDHGRDSGCERTWVMDPIDGTSGFLSGRRYSIALGLLINGKPVFGLLACPEYPYPGGTGLLFQADREVARSQALDDSLIGAQKLKVSRQADPRLAKGVEGVEKGHSDHRALGRIRSGLGADPSSILRLDGQDKYASVACGEADYYLRFSPTRQRAEKVWDHTAGALLVTAAGGRVTDLEGRPLDFSRGERLSLNRGIVASNGQLHQSLLDGIRLAQI